MYTPRDLGNRHVGYERPSTAVEDPLDVTLRSDMAHYGFCVVKQHQDGSRERIAPTLFIVDPDEEEPPPAATAKTEAQISAAAARQKRWREAQKAKKNA